MNVRLRNSSLRNSSLISTIGHQWVSAFKGKGFKVKSKSGVRCLQSGVTKVEDHFTVSSINKD